MDIGDAVRLVERRWGLNGAHAETIVDGLTATVRLPEASAAVHVSRVLPSPRRVHALQAARARLAEQGVPVVALLPSITGDLFEAWQGRFVEVERWVEHDGRMNTWERLRDGAAMLAWVHDAWADLDLGPAGEACTWANWVSTSDAAARSPAAAHRLTDWGSPDLASEVLQLSQRTAVEVPLPRQLVHGDFWDNNVYFREEQIVAITDFDFLGRRPRIDDLALMLYFADEEPYVGEQPRSSATDRRRTQDRIADLAPLVRTYSRHLHQPLSDAELAALPYALARQPLWTYTKRMIEHHDQERARRDAVDTGPSVARALAVLDDPERWSHAFAS